MVTGIESTGIVLAILPLLINQLSNYAEGFETLRSLVTGRYKREFETYSNKLGTQQTLFRNALTQLLYDVIEYEEDVTAMIDKPGHPLWQDEQVVSSIKSRLGRDYSVYIATMGDLSSQLEALAKKISLREEVTPKTDLKTEAFKVEIRTFLGVFRKSVYDAIYSGIKDANDVLRVLNSDALWRETSQKSRLKGRRPLVKYKTIHRYAKSLHKVLKRRCSSCLLHKHIASLCLEPQLYDLQILSQRDFTYKFNLTLVSKDAGKPDTKSRPTRIEVEPINNEITYVGSSPAGDATVLSMVHSKTGAKKITFTANISTSSVSSQRSPSIPIDNLCMALKKASTCMDRRCIGYISDETEKDHRHQMYYIRAMDQEPQMKTLEDLLRSAMSQQRWEVPIISRRDRLVMAAILASTVLQLHGSWLKSRWTSKDIVFLDFGPQKDSTSDLPHLSYELATDPDALNNQLAGLSTKPLHPLIRSQSLFPLGLALVELALCQPFDTLVKPEDAHSDPDVTNLTTATRLLQAVLGQEGTKYHDVVARCLNWSGSPDNGDENEKFQQAVFELVIQPLHDMLKEFDSVQ